MSSCFSCSVAINVFLLFCPHSLRFAQMKHLTNTYCEWMTPNHSDVAAHKHGLNTWEGPNSHQSDRIHFLSTWLRNPLHHPCLKYAWPLSGNEKIRFTFSSPAIKCDHHNCHLAFNINLLHKAKYSRGGRCLLFLNDAMFWRCDIFQFLTMRCFERCFSIFNDAMF